VTLLKTDRLLLTEIKPEDKLFILELLNTPGWLTHIGDRNVSTPEEAEKYINSSFTANYEQYGFGLYKVLLKNTTVPIGVCGLLKRKKLQDVDIGYAILPQYEGHGYTFEAANKVLEYAKHALHKRSIMAYTGIDNEGSQKLLTKLGFKYEGTSASNTTKIRIDNVKLR